MAAVNVFRQHIAITSHALLTVSTQEDSILIQTLTFDDKAKHRKDNALPTESTKQKKRIITIVNLRMHD
jgi:hypothetical protein